MLARDFFAVVAKDRAAFTALAAIVSSNDPTRSYGRHLPKAVESSLNGFICDKLGTPMKEG